GGVRRVAAGLAARGFAKGDVFAIFSPNLPEYALAFYGVSAAGGVNTTISPLYTTDELARQLGHAGRRFLLAVPPPPPPPPTPPPTCPASSATPAPGSC